MRHPLKQPPPGLKGTHRHPEDPRSNENSSKLEQKQCRQRQKSSKHPVDPKTPVTVHGNQRNIGLATAVNHQPRFAGTNHRARNNKPTNIPAKPTVSSVLRLELQQHRWPIEQLRAETRQGHLAAKRCPSDPQMSMSRTKKTTPLVGQIGG